jgi:hypothetical protein
MLEAEDMRIGGLIGRTVIVTSTVVFKLLLVAPIGALILF